MTPRCARALVVLTVIANTAAAVSYSGVGPTDPAARMGWPPWNPVLAWLADLLTLPIPTPGITDVRDVVLLASLGVALLLVAAGRPTGRIAGEGRDAADHALGAPSLAERYLRYGAGLVLVLALLSAAVNGVFDLSWGWIVRFAAGAGWALLLARTFTPVMTRRALFALIIMAACCSALTVADRADRGLAYFRWPIGPITATAALASVWAATAGTWAAGLVFCHRWFEGSSEPGRPRPGQCPTPQTPTRPGPTRQIMHDLVQFRRWGGRMFLLGAACALTAYVVQQTGRRGPMLGMLVGGVGGVSLLLWGRYRRSRLVKAGLIGLLVIMAAGGGVYVVGQLRSPVREVSGPLALRLAYWRMSADMIGERPWLGSGPDTFGVEMTNAVAPFRAESPHFFHGNVSLYAHNEWIQAAVELGIPAALAYLALPLGILVLSARRSFLSAAAGAQERSEGPRAGEAHGTADTAVVHGDPATRPIVAALIAGLVAILVTESSGITLRVPVMPIGYWTLLGLLAAMVPLRRRAEPKASRRRIPPSGVGAACVLAAAACLAVSGSEIHRAISQARMRVGPDGRLGSRLYADKTIAARYRAALFATSQLGSAQPGQPLQTAEALWRDLHETIPALHDVPAAYAETLMLRGDAAAARRVLEDALSDRLNPYSAEANTLYARLLADDPVGRLRCVQRALRAGGLDPALQEILAGCADDPKVAEALQREVPEARSHATGGADIDAAAMEPELLRISAFLNARAGPIDTAIEDQRSAAECYRRLEQEQSPYRRTDRAETDAFQRLASMLFDADPGNFEKACDAIERAEYYAVLGIMHERVARPEPERGFVGGVVLPMETPDRLRAMWRLSALLHVAAGREYFLMGRVMAGMPTDQRNSHEAVRQELGRVYRQAYERLLHLPPEQRPAHFDDVRRMAQASGTGR